MFEVAQCPVVEFGEVRLDFPLYRNHEQKCPSLFRDQSNVTYGARVGNTLHQAAKTVPGLLTGRIEQEA